MAWSAPPVYRADALLGAGGVGRVYSATHSASGRRVALKTLRTLRDQSNTFGLLMREAAAVAQLSHPNIVELLDLVVHVERPYLVLELIEGTNVRSWISEWPGWNVVRTALNQLLEALSVAHAVGIVHRDIKPENLLLARDGRLKITDFGIATVLNPLADGTESLRGGTPRYMAPEQLDPDGHFGPWTDLYAVGVIAYELLSGVSPVRGPRATWHIQKRQAPPPLPARAEIQLSRGIRKWVLRLLHPDPTCRPRFAAVARRELSEIADGVRERGARPSSPLSSVPAELSSISEMEDPPTTPIVRERSSAPFSEPAEQPPSIAELPFEIPAPSELGASAAMVSLRPPPMVGRARERDLLERMIAEVIVSRRPRALMLSGEAGVGKSRLARWALAEVERLGLMDGSAASFDVSGTTDGLRQLLRRLAGPARRPDTDPWSSLALRRFRLDEAGIDIARLDAFLQGDARSSDLSRAERVELCAKTLVHASRVFPLYLWLDDVGWARDGTHELVEMLLDSADAPIVMVMTMRAGTAEHPRLKPWLSRLRKQRRASHGALERFSPEEVEELLGAVLPLAPETRADLAPVIGDIPHVVTELVQFLVATAELVATPEGFRPAGGRSVSELLARAPRGALHADRVQKLINAFGSDAQLAERVLLRGALFGNRFNERELAAAVPDANEKRVVPLAIGQALLHGILRLEPDLSNRFEHELVREALLARLERRADAATLFRDVGDATLALRGAQRWDAQVTAGRLLARAGDTDRALELVSEAALNLARLAAYREAEEYLREAREWVEKARSDARLARLLIAESMVPYLELDFPRAFALNHAAESYARAAGDTHALVRCLADRADFHYYNYEFAASERLARETLTLIVDDHPESELAVSLAAFRLAELACLRGEMEAAREHYERSYEASKRTPIQLENPELVGQDLAIAELALIAFELALGEIESAARRYARLSELAKEPRNGEWRPLLHESAFQLAVARGVACESSGEIEGFLDELEARNDVWRTTSVSLLAALAATETNDARAVATTTDRFLAAFEICPHEKPFTFWALRTLAERLAARGERERSTGVERAVDRLRARVARGFAV